MASISQRNSIFSGILLLLLAGVLAMSGLLWNSFIDFTAPKGIQEVFSNLSEIQSSQVTTSFGNWKEIAVCFTIPQGDLFRFFELVGPRLQRITSRFVHHAKIDIAADSADVVHRVEAGKALIGAVSAVSYAKLRRQHPIQAVLERTGSTPKLSLFVVRADSTASTVADLRGKNICFRSKDSMSGYFVPIQELKSQGIDPDTFFGQISYNDNLTNSTLGLMSGEYDATVLSNIFFEELPPEERTRLRVLHSSKPIPGGVYIAAATPPAILPAFLDEFRRFGGTISATEPLAGLFQVKIPNPSEYDMLETAADSGE